MFDLGELVQETPLLAPDRVGLGVLEALHSSGIVSLLVLLTLPRLLPFLLLFCVGEVTSLDGVEQDVVQALCSDSPPSPSELHQDIDDTCFRGLGDNKLCR